MNGHGRQLRATGLDHKPANCWQWQRIVGCVERTAREMVGCARSRTLENAYRCSGPVRVTHHCAGFPCSTHPTAKDCACNHSSWQGYDQGRGNIRGRVTRQPRSSSSRPRTVSSEPPIHAKDRRINNCRVFQCGRTAHGVCLLLFLRQLLIRRPYLAFCSIVCPQKVCADDEAVRESNQRRAILNLGAVNLTRRPLPSISR